MSYTDLVPEGVRTSFVRLGFGVPGVLYEPIEPTAKAAIGIFVMHANGDYLNFSAGPELARRGYRVLCANNSTSKSGVFDDGVLDQVLREAKAGVTYLRNHPDVDKVVLFGHSGGATVMTAYQLIAEGGVDAARGAGLIHKCPDDLSGLPAADAVVLADANYGQSTMTLLSIEPAIVDESTGMKLDPALDMFNPDNGFVATGSTYSPEFVKTFLAAQGARNNALIDHALERLALIESGEGRYADDEPFYVPGGTYHGNNNKLFTQDVRLLARSVKPWPLVHKDGLSTTQIIPSVRPARNTKNFSRSLQFGALKTTVRNFLSSYATRVGPDFGYGEDSHLRDVDWRSNYANPPGNVEGITVPLLLLGMTGGWEGLAAEEIYEHSASADKSLAFIEGATHNYAPCTDCESTPREFGDTVKTTYDYVDGWLSAAGRLLP